MEYEEKLSTLRNQRDEIGQRMERIREAGADSWEALKEGAEKALSDLVGGLAKAKERLEPAVSGR